MPWPAVGAAVAVADVVASVVVAECAPAAELVWAAGVVIVPQAVDTVVM
jgi:hypothetical protein